MRTFQTSKYLILNTFNTPKACFQCSLMNYIFVETLILKDGFSGRSVRTEDQQGL